MGCYRTTHTLQEKNRREHFNIYVQEFYLAYISTKAVSVLLKQTSQLLKLNSLVCVNMSVLWINAYVHVDLHLSSWENSVSQAVKLRLRLL